MMNNLYIFKNDYKFNETTGECERVNAVEVNCAEGSEEFQKTKVNTCGDHSDL